MNKSIVVGVVGCGYWGPNLVRNLKSLPNCNLKVMCDVNEARLKHLKSLYAEVEGVTDFDYLLNGIQLDAIVIATPVKYHYRLAKASLLAGKHTFIEKPMASSSVECEELIEIADRKRLVLMVGHTFLYSAPVRKIVEVVQAGDLGEIRYISSRRLNLGLFQKDINVAWDLAPHDISIILHILREPPLVVNCQGNAHLTPGIEDVTNISLAFRNKRFATIQSSWLEPRKIREMTIVGTRRMIVYDDLETNEKIRIYDVRVERPPHYDTFGDFHYSYHYGDSYIPQIKQEEPLKAECQHFLDCIESGATPLTGGREGLELVRILEAASQSLKCDGAPVVFSRGPEQLMPKDSGVETGLVESGKSGCRNGRLSGHRGISANSNDGRSMVNGVTDEGVPAEIWQYT
jgi:predicted dehydrogenase